MKTDNPDSTHHICLISAHLPANLIPVLSERPACVHLVVSDDMKAMGQRFRKLLADHAIVCELHEGVPGTGLTELREYAENLVLQLTDQAPEARLVLNATGGTKLMALAFVEAFRQTDAEIVYTDTGRDRLESLTDRQQPVRELAHVLTVPVYLAAYGLTLRSAASDDDEWRAGAERRKALSKWLGQHAAELGDFLGVLNHRAQLALTGNGKTLASPEQRLDGLPHGRWREALGQFAEAGLLAWSGAERIVFPDADAARYCGGHWLEEYVWHLAGDERPDDVRAGVVGTWEGDRHQPSRNEFDLLAVHANRMLVIECKTVRFGRDLDSDTDLLYKLDSLGRNAGGLFGKVMLVSARSLSQTARERARTNHVSVIEAAGLKHLRQSIRDWMGR